MHKNDFPTGKRVQEKIFHHFSNLGEIYEPWAESKHEVNPEGTIFLKKKKAVDPKCAMRDFSVWNKPAGHKCGPVARRQETVQQNSSRRCVMLKNERQSEK